MADNFWQMMDEVFGVKGRMLAPIPEPPTPPQISFDPKRGSEIGSTHEAKLAAQALSVWQTAKQSFEIAQAGLIMVEATYAVAGNRDVIDALTDAISDAAGMVKMLDEALAAWQREEGL